MASSEKQVAVFPVRILKELENGRYDFKGLRTIEEAESLGLNYPKIISERSRFMNLQEVDNNTLWKQVYVYVVVTDTRDLKVLALRSFEHVKGGRMAGKEIFGKYHLGLGDNILRSDEFLGDQHQEGIAVFDITLTRILDYGFEISGSSLETNILGFINGLKAMPQGNENFGEKQFGIVYLVKTDSSEVRVKDKSLDGTMLNFDKLSEIASTANAGRSKEPYFDEWSRSIYKLLNGRLHERESEAEKDEEERGRGKHRRNRRRHGRGDKRRD